MSRGGDGGGAALPQYEQAPGEYWPFSSMMLVLFTVKLSKIGECSTTPLTFIAEWPSSLSLSLSLLPVGVLGLSWVMTRARNMPPCLLTAHSLGNF